MQRSNTIYQVTEIEESGDVTPVVSVAEFKNYIRAEGFIDAGAGSDTSFDDDDALMVEMLFAATGMLEEKLNVSLTAKQYTVTLTNDYGGIQLPFGPVRTLGTILNQDGVEDTNGTVRGDFLYGATGCNMTVNYTAGYITIPKALLLEVKRLAAYLYINRGDDPTAQHFTYQIAGKYSRKSWLV